MMLMRSAGVGGDWGILTYHAPDQTKPLAMRERFFEELRRFRKQFSSWMVVLYIGDGNLRWEARLPGEEDVLGPHVCAAGSPHSNPRARDSAASRPRTATGPSGCSSPGTMS